MLKVIDAAGSIDEVYDRFVAALVACFSIRPAASAEIC